LVEGLLGWALFDRFGRTGRAGNEGKVSADQKEKEPYLAHPGQLMEPDPKEDQKNNKAKNPDSDEPPAV
jgi:hypothetical protein